LGFQNFIHIVHKDATRKNSKIPTQKTESIRVAVKNPKEASNVVELFWHRNASTRLQKITNKIFITLVC